MKRFILLAFCLSLIPACHPAAAPQETEASALEKQGDGYYAACNEIKNTDMAITNMDLAAGKYLKAFDLGAPNARRLYKYVKARDFKYRFLTGTKDEKKAEYTRLITKYEPFKGNFSGTKEFNYTMAILWGRVGEITQDTFDMSNKPVAEKIKKYAEALYGIDRKFENYAACKILGRLHYKAPKVPLILTWPDRKKSKAYLEEMIKGDPGNSEGKMFLADTIWDTGDTKTAEKLYRQVITAQPRKNFWFYDVRAMKLCDARMKKLQIGK